jgi:hypothetical protein
LMSIATCPSYDTSTRGQICLMRSLNCAALECSVGSKGTNTTCILMHVQKRIAYSTEECTKDARRSSGLTPQDSR